MESNKVKLPKEVAEAIENLRGYGWTDFYIVVKSGDDDATFSDVKTIRNWIRNNTGEFDREEEKATTHLLQALVNGYQIKE